MFKPVYSITPSILNAISEISEVKTVVERSKVLPLNEAQLRRQALVRMAHTSTSIEGNKLAEFQVDKVLSGLAVAADDKSIQEVKNYQQALKEIDNFANTSSRISINQILSLHGLLMTKLLPSDKAGHFRPGPIYIVDDLGDGREKLRFEGPDSKKVPFLVNELLKWLLSDEAKSLHPVVKSGVFHVQFVTVHPFSDGNGRMARLLTALILYQSNWDFRKILVLEDYYNRNRIAYYNALNQVQGKHYHSGEDLTPWLEYYTQGFLAEARKVAEAIAAIGFANKDLDSSQIFLDKSEIKIMDFLTTTGRATSSDVQDILGLAKRTAQLKLKILTDKHLIKQMGKGPSSYYIINE